MRAVLAPENATSASRYIQPLFSKYQSRCSVNLTVEMEARPGVPPFWCKPSIISYVNIRTLWWSKWNFLFGNRLAVVCYESRLYGSEVGNSLAWMQTLLLFRKLKVLRQQEEKNGSNKICFGTSIICVVVVVDTKPQNVFQKRHYRVLA